MGLVSLLLVALVSLEPGDELLPFDTPGDVTAFLREAKVVEVSSKRLKGTTQPRKVLLERDGVRVNAVFRSVDTVHYNSRWDDGRFTTYLHDSYQNEIAAYELSLLLGLDTVPPTVPRTLGRKKGSLQLWIEKGEPGYNPLKEARQPPDMQRWIRERLKMRVFDELIENIDRNVGNMLIDSTGKVWWIDHTRAFGNRRELDDAGLITQCDRQLFEALKAAEPKAIAERLSPYVGRRQIEALLERRLRLIALIEERIAAEGEAAVLFTMEASAAVDR